VSESRDEAARWFGEHGEKYKAEWVQRDFPTREEISVYRQGNWLDMCTGRTCPRPASSARPSSC
jgi:threonyl-tRNA synthetase